MGVTRELKDGTIVEIQQPEGTLEEQRRRRSEALRAAAGIWKDRKDIPDGVEYQEKIRGEWD